MRCISSPFLVAIALAALPTGLLGQRATLFFDDGFESRNTLAWDGQVPALVEPDVFRWTDLDLRDPHVYIQSFGCFDHTAHGALGFSVNDELAESLVTDADVDGYLDRSYLTVFRPLDTGASDGRLDYGPTRCVAPNPPASCDWTDRWLQTPETFSYLTLASPGESCIFPSSAIFNAGYSPAIALPSGPCFRTNLGTISVEFLGAPVLLRGTVVGATFSGNPPTSLVNGLLAGFLTEADADATILPAELPLVGGQALSILFPGGTGNCAGHDDRDTYQDESGWWVFFNFVANPLEPPAAVCGNGVAEAGEACDGVDLDGASCATATGGALPNGTLACTTGCTFDLGGCSP